MVFKSSINNGGGGGGGVTSVNSLTGAITLASAGGTVVITNPSGSIINLETSGSAPTFDLIGSGTNTTAAMVVGSGATMSASGTGTIAATTSAKLTTGRTISITGDIAYTSPSFDGTGNVTAAGTLATVNANVGSFTNANITVNAKGLITAASNGSSGGTPGGSNTQIQFNDAGSFGGASTYVYDKTTGAVTNSANGAASVSPLTLAGNVFTGGSATTTKPFFLLEPTGTAAVSTWNTAGTQIGINAILSYAGNFLDFHVAGGASVFNVASNGAMVVGAITASGNVSIAGTTTFPRSGSTAGVVLMTGTIFTGGTGTTNFPNFFIQPTGTTPVTTWSTSGTGIGMNLASGFAGNFIDLHVAGGASLFSVGSAGNIVSASSLVVGTSSGIQWSTRSLMTSPADGNIRLTNAAANDFGLLQLGGTTSSFPALKRVTTGLVSRLADDSADAPFTASTLTASGSGTGIAQFTSGALSTGNLSGDVTTSGSLVVTLATVTVPKGGTGNTTFTAYSVICAGTTATGAFQNVSGLGTAGQVLTSNGAGALPTWQTDSALTILTTKGDLFGFSTVNARIPIGTNGQVLTADSAQTLGLKWAAAGGTGTVTSVATDATLTGGPITTTGTLGINLSNANTWAALQTFGTNISIGGVTATGATGTGNVMFSASPTTTGTLTAAAITASGIATFSVNGASSAAGVSITGTTFSGTGTTSVPLVYINAGSAPTTWNTGSTQFGINAASGFAGNFLDFHVNGGTSVFAVASTGAITSAGAITAGSGSVINWSTRSRLLSQASGSVTLQNSGATNSFTLSAPTATATPTLQLGALDAAAPVAQILSVQNVVAGTSNTAGTNFTISGSQGTGTGAGGSILFRVAAAGTSGTSQNALATAVTIDSTSTVTFNALGTGIAKVTSGAFSVATAGTDYVAPGTVTAFTAAQYFTQQSLTDASTITWNANTQQAAYVLLTSGVGGTRVLGAPSNLHAGASYTLIVQQSATGSNALTYNAVYKWPSGSAPVLSTANNAIDVLTFITDGTNMYGVAQKGFA